MLNQKVYKQLIRGLEQYLWYLGQDTMDRENNLLIENGFRRYRVYRHGGSSKYRSKWRSRTVELHSFCVGIYGNKKDGFLFVRADDLAYAYLGNKAPIPGHYRKALLMRPIDKGSKQRFFKASCEFLKWLEEYEAWIDGTYGKGYRIGCYRRYHNKWLSPANARKWFQMYRNSEDNEKLMNFFVK